MWSRHDLKKSLLPVVTSLLILTIYKPLILEAAVLTLMCGSWCALLVRALVTFATAATTLHIYAGLAQSIGIF